MSDFRWGALSLQRLNTCHPALISLCNKALEISPFDLFILEGHRSRERQAEMVRNGVSKVEWPNSKHNSEPSLAVDIAPYPVDWANSLGFHVLAGVMFSAGNLIDLKNKGFRIRWGGDWAGTWTDKDQTFNDLPHYELRPLS